MGYDETEYQAAIYCTTEGNKYYKENRWFGILLLKSISLENFIEWLLIHVVIS